MAERSMTPYEKNRPTHFLVAERWDGDDLIARWTDETPGKTGPPGDDLERTIGALVINGWKVYREPRVPAMSGGK